MKIIGLIFTLLTAFSLNSYCQELGEEDNNFHFIEAGIGTGLNQEPPAINLGLANGLGKTMANFLDYSMYFKKPGVKHHEISVKIGPYMRIDKYSYLAISSGASIFINSSNSSWEYQNGMLVYEEQYQINIPIQARVNAALSKGLCAGVKATFNKMIDKNNPDRASLLVYLAYGW